MYHVLRRKSDGLIWAIGVAPFERRVIPSHSYPDEIKDLSEVAPSQKEETASGRASLSGRDPARRDPATQEVKPKKARICRYLLTQ